MWLDPFCRNMELAAQAEHEDDLPENLSEITDLWNSPARTHVSHGPRRDTVSPSLPPPQLLSRPLLPQGTFGREPSAAKPEDDRYLRAAIQEYDNIAKLGQIMREGPIKVSVEGRRPAPRSLLLELAPSRVTAPEGDVAPKKCWDEAGLPLIKLPPLDNP